MLCDLVGADFGVARCGYSAVNFKINEREGPPVEKRRKCDLGLDRGDDGGGRRRGEDAVGGDGYGHARKKVRVGQRSHYYYY